MLISVAAPHNDCVRTLLPSGSISAHPEDNGFYHRKKKQLVLLPFQVASVRWLLSRGSSGDKGGTTVPLGLIELWQTLRVNQQGRAEITTFMSSAKARGNAVCALFLFLLIQHGQRS